MQKKQCSRCRKLKDIDLFYRLAASKDGHQPHCIECDRKRKQVNYLSNKHKILAHNKKWLADNVEKRRAYLLKWQSKNRAKCNAIKAVYRAVKKGVLIRPDRCAKCNKQCKPHGHHKDYAKRLDVEWLCYDCHKLWHRENGEALNG